MAVRQTGVWRARRDRSRTGLHFFMLCDVWLRNAAPCRRKGRLRQSFRPRKEGLELGLATTAAHLGKKPILGILFIKPDEVDVDDLRQQPFQMAVEHTHRQQQTLSPLGSVAKASAHSGCV